MISQRHKDLAEWYIFVMREMTGIDPMAKGRQREYVLARAVIAHCLEMEGCPLVNIARLLEKNHSTIVYYRGRFETIFTPGNDAEREFWEKFKNEI